MLADIFMTENSFSLENLKDIEIENIISSDTVEIERIESLLDTVDDDTERLSAALSLAKEGYLYSGPEVDMYMGLINIPAKRLGIQIEQAEVFAVKGSYYEVSMESGITIHWSDIISFIGKAVTYLLDLVRSQSVKRFTNTARLRDAGEKAVRSFSTMHLENKEILKQKVPMRYGIRYMIMDYKGKEPVIAEPKDIKDLMVTLKATLDPREYRDNIQLLLRILLSGKNYDTATMDTQFKLARNTLIENLKGYISLTNTTRKDDGTRVLTSDESIGFINFQATFMEDKYTAPKVTLEEKSIRHYKENFELEPCDPATAGRLAESVRLACEVILAMRTQYDDVRQFKKLSKQASKALKERKANGKVVDSEIVAMYRSIPSYVRLYHHAFKAKSDAIYNYAFSIMAYISASKECWKVKVD